MRSAIAHGVGAGVVARVDVGRPFLLPIDWHASQRPPALRGHIRDRRLRRRPLRRVPIYRQEEWAPDVYPRYNPGPNAVRDCTAHYVQEYRPSGTVITPRMNCYWRPG